MSNKNHISSINKILGSAIFGKSRSNHGMPIPYLSFGSGVYNVLFEGYEPTEVYTKELEQLYNSNLEITNSYTLRKYEEELIDLLRILNSEKRTCSQNDYDQFLAELLKVELKEFEVLNEIWGMKMSKAKMKFGDFTIYHLIFARNELVEKYPDFSNARFTEDLESTYVIGVTIKAREQNKAVEKARAYYSTFENAVNYMVADLRHARQVTIIGNRHPSNLVSIVCNSKGIGQAGLKSGVYFDVDIEHEVFMDELQGNNLIWPLITKNSLTKIEERILSAIEWMGKAYIEKEMPKSLIQFVFAVEGMLQYNEGQFITPSIVSQLSDWLAFIICDNLEERKKIASYFKDVYQKRSAIAHGAKKNVKLEDLGNAARISKLMIISFLTYPPLKEIKSIEELGNYMTKLKFS